jgi:septum formation protein
VAQAAPLVLASASPQRRGILERLGVRFALAAPATPELEQGPPEEVALENSYRKAAAVAARPEHAGATVLAADTVVAIGTRIYGKPAGRAQAEATLRELSGRRHAVLSGVCVIEGAPEGRPRTAAARTVVEFRALCEPLLRWYLDSGEWRERAGGYAIQGRGAALVKRIEGDYTNVVGLPVATLLELLPALLRS